jgi:chitinase
VRKPQTITFDKLANRTFGEPDFTVSARASSGLPVSFAATGKCTASSNRIHLTGAGACTLTASQPGNTLFNPAPSVSQKFAIAAVTRCTVPNVIGKKLAAAKTALGKRHCRAGRITRAFSSRRRKGTIVSQSRRAGQVLATGTKINLVVSRGRRH